MNKYQCQVCGAVSYSAASQENLKDNSCLECDGRVEMVEGDKMNANEIVKKIRSANICDIAIARMEAADLIESLQAQTKVTGETSDGYHTFNELYHHRAVLFSVICNDRPNVSWKSKLHHDGTMFDGMFIVGIQTPEGQATYHYDIDPYWDMFRVPELPQAPEWDGHTSEQAIERIGRLTQPENKPLTLDELRKMDEEPVWVKRGSNGWWMVIAKHHSNQFNALADRFDFTSGETLHDCKYGMDWLAYRSKPKEEV